MAERNYRGFLSEPVRLNTADLNLDRSGSVPGGGGPGTAAQPTGAPAKGAAKRGGPPRKSTARKPGRSSGKPPVDFCMQMARVSMRSHAWTPHRSMAAVNSFIGAAPTGGARRGGREHLCKKYGQGFVWGQLSNWFKQTVYDPTASLSADRRGTLSLPDAESTYSGKYGKKVCAASSDEAVSTNPSTQGGGSDH